MRFSRGNSSWSSIFCLHIPTDTQSRDFGWLRWSRNICWPFQGEPFLPTIPNHPAHPGICWPAGPQLNGRIIRTRSKWSPSPPSSVSQFPHLQSGSVFLLCKTHQPKHFWGMRRIINQTQVTSQFTVIFFFSGKNKILTIQSDFQVPGNNNNKKKTISWFHNCKASPKPDTSAPCMAPISKASLAPRNL